MGLLRYGLCKELRKLFRLLDFLVTFEQDNIGPQFIKTFDGFYVCAHWGLVNSMINQFPVTQLQSWVGLPSQSACHH